VTALLIALAFVAGIGSGVGMVNVKRRGPVNVVRGVLLPHPADEHWQKSARLFNCGDYRHELHVVFQLGAVVVVDGCRVGVEGVILRGAKRYGAAVVKAQLERSALAAALGDS
jgi:hypothetical protein